MARPVVYLGPSAPADAVRAALPEAVIRPPVARGDLYRDRLLRFSVFVILDGVFAQEDAISPREVVDVLGDGAAVLGAASMGALRAVDCAPAGAEGAGQVYRLFQRGAVSSEDEVAVIFQPERPYPSASLSLIHIRVALRRAVRAGQLPRDQALALAQAAEGLHFSRRSWRALALAAGMAPLPADLRAQLDGWDPKRADAVQLCTRVARRLRQTPEWGDRPRANRGGFGIAQNLRQTNTDPLCGRNESDVWLPFLLWMLASGRLRFLPGVSLTSFGKLLTAVLDRTDEIGTLRTDCFQQGAIMVEKDVLDQLHAQYSVAREWLVKSDSFESEWFRFIQLQGFGSSGDVPSECRALAETEIAEAHGLTQWAEVLARFVPAQALVVEAAGLLGRGKMERAKRFRCEGPA